MEWDKFLGAKFSRPESDSNRDLECLVADDDLLNDTELNECLDALRSGKAVGCDNVPVEDIADQLKRKVKFSICAA